MDFFSALLATHLIATASATATAGGLPSYPNVVNRKADLPVGSPMIQLETADSRAKVDAWHGAQLPRNCRHETAQGGAKPARGEVKIMITTDHGKTLITHSSSMGGMLGH